MSDQENNGQEEEEEEEEILTEQNEDAQEEQDGGAKSEDEQNQQEDENEDLAAEAENDNDNDNENEAENENDNQGIAAGDNKNQGKNQAKQIQSQNDEENQEEEEEENLAAGDDENQEQNQEEQIQSQNGEENQEEEENLAAEVNENDEQNPETDAQTNAIKDSNLKSEPQNQEKEQANIKKKTDEKPRINLARKAAEQLQKQKTQQKVQPIKEKAETAEKAVNKTETAVNKTETAEKAVNKSENSQKSAKPSQNMDQLTKLEQQKLKERQKKEELVEKWKQEQLALKKNSTKSSTFLARKLPKSTFVEAQAPKQLTKPVEMPIQNLSFKKFASKQQPNSTSLQDKFWTYSEGDFQKLWLKKTSHIEVQQVKRKQVSHIEVIKFSETLKEPLNLIIENDVSPIFDLVINGQLLELNEIVTKPGKVFPPLDSFRDPEGKTLLMYACYYNYGNMLLYLLSRGATPYLTDLNGLSLFHFACFYGRLQIARLVFHHERHKERSILLNELHVAMQKFAFKNSDFKKGIYIGLVKREQEQIETFQAFILDLAYRLFDTLVKKFEQSVCVLDTQQLNPLHYSCMNSYTLSFATGKFLLEIDRDIEGFGEFVTMYEEIQQLKDAQHSDANQQRKAIEYLENMIKAEDYSYVLSKFQKKLNTLRAGLLTSADNKLKESPIDLALKNLNNSKASLLSVMAGQGVLQNRPQLALSMITVDEGKIDANGWNKLHHACSGGRLEEVQSILTKRGSVLSKQHTNVGYLPIHLAIQQDHEEIVRYLLLQIDESHLPEFLEAREKKDNCTCFMFAARHGALKCMQLLFTLKANIYATDERRKWTALHHACYNAHQQIIVKLLEYDADKGKFLRMRDSSQKTPQQLLDAQLRHLFKPGNIWLASLQGDYDSVRKLVLVQGQDVNQKSLQLQLTPLHLAVRYQHLTVVQFLLQQGAEREAEAKGPLNLLKGQERGMLSCDPVTPLGYAEEVLKYAQLKNDKDIEKLELAKHIFQKVYLK